MISCRRQHFIIMMVLFALTCINHSVECKKEKSKKKEKRKGKRIAKKKSLNKNKIKPLVLSERSYADFPNFGNNKLPELIKKTNFTNTTDWETDTDPTPEEHGVENKMISYMIVGGEAVSLNEYKQKYQFMCSVLREQDFNDKTYIVHSCGCTMIAPNVALTAAHCAEYADYVKVGKLYRDTSQNENARLKVETYRVKAIRVHKDFDHDTFSNDVMLLKLNGKTEKPLAKMQFSNIQRNVNDEMTIVGWGFISSESQIPASTLRDVNVKYTSTPTCKEYYGEMINDESMFCAFDKGKDACQGDSGGPIIRETEDGQVVQVGIVSWGYQCAVFPGVYTDLSKEIITNFIHTTVCHARHGISTQSCIKGKLPNII